MCLAIAPTRLLVVVLILFTVPYKLCQFLGEAELLEGGFSEAQWCTFTVLFCFSHLYFPASGQAVVTGLAPSPPRFLPSIFIAQRVQQSQCWSIFHRVLLTHSLALSASQFVHKKKSHRIYTNMHSAGLELTKLTYTRLEDNLIRHRGDRHYFLCIPW